MLIRRMGEPIRITWLWLLNFIVLQWFGVRLARVLDEVHGGIVFDDAGQEVGFAWENGRWEPIASARPPAPMYQQTGWALHRWVWPLTGWWSPYIRIVGKR